MCALYIVVLDHGVDIAARRGRGIHPRIPTECVPGTRDLVRVGGAVDNLGRSCSRNRCFLRLLWMGTVATQDRTQTQAEGEVHSEPKGRGTSFSTAARRSQGRRRRRSDAFTRACKGSAGSPSWEKLHISEQGKCCGGVDARPTEAKPHVSEQGKRYGGLDG